MKHQRKLSGIFAALGMLVLILDSEASLLGAGEGLDLCIKTVIPSLFPFFFLSGILVQEWTGRPISFLRPLGQFLGMPEGSESLLITGFLGGYPVGAKAVRDTWKAGSLSKKDANRLLAFCSNAGPAFLFGMAAPMLAKPQTGWILWGIQIISAMTVGLLHRDVPESNAAIPPQTRKSISENLIQALMVTAQVCGWVISFRILTTFAQRWFLWLLPRWWSVLFSGILELTNGCLSLSGIENEKIRFILCSALLSWGGICVVMQTASVTQGLELSSYIRGKLLQTAFSILISAVIVGFLPPILLILPVVVGFGQKIVKRSSIPRPADV